jgi:hypothetical protein
MNTAMNESFSIQDVGIQKLNQSTFINQRAGTTNVSIEEKVNGVSRNMAMEFCVSINLKIYACVGNFISCHVLKLTLIYMEEEYIHSFFIQNTSQCQVHCLLTYLLHGAESFLRN